MVDTTAWSYTCFTVLVFEYICLLVKEEKNIQGNEVIDNGKYWYIVNMEMRKWGKEFNRLFFDTNEVSDKNIIPWTTDT